MPVEAADLSGRVGPEHDDPLVACKGETPAPGRKGQRAHRLRRVVGRRVFGNGCAGRHVPDGDFARGRGRRGQSAGPRHRRRDHAGMGQHRSAADAKDIERGAEQRTCARVGIACIGGAEDQRGLFHPAVEQGLAPLFDEKLVQAGARLAFAGLGHLAGVFRLGPGGLGGGGVLFGLGAGSVGDTARGDGVGRACLGAVLGGAGDLGAGRGGAALAVGIPGGTRRGDRQRDQRRDRALTQPAATGGAGFGLGDEGAFRAGETQITARGELSRLFQRQARGQEKLRVAPGFFPAVRGKGHAGADAQEFPVLLEPCAQPRPRGQDRFMRQRYGRGAVIGTADHEQTRGDEAVDQPTFRRSGCETVKRRGPFRGRLILTKPHMHDPAHHGRQRRLRRRVKRAERVLGTLAQRARHPAQTVMGFPCQDTGRCAGLVEFFEREFQQRQAVGFGRRLVAQRVVEPRAGVGMFLETQPRTARGQADDLGDLGRGGRHQVILPVRALERGKRRDFHAAVIEVAAQRRDDEDPARPGERGHRLHEGVAGGGVDARGGEQFFQLIDQQRQPRLWRRGDGGAADRLAVGIGYVALRRDRRLGRVEGRLLRRLRQRPLQKRCRPLRIGAQQGGQFRPRGPVAEEFGQRVGAGQRGGEGLEEVRCRLGRAQDRAAPQAHAFDHTRFHQKRHDPGAHQARLAAAAAAENEDKGLTRRRLPPQRIEHAGNRMRPAIEDGGMFELEGFEPAEGRSLPARLVRCGGRGGQREVHAHLLQPPLDQLVEMDLEGVLELGGIAEGVKGREKRSVLIVEPFLDEPVERALLAQAFLDLSVVRQGDERFGHLAIDQQIGPPAFLHRAPGVFEFVFRATVIARPILALDMGGQARAEARPQDAHDDVGGGRLFDLVLEGGGGQKRLVLPDHRRQARDRRIAFGKTLHHPVGEDAFLVHVAG